jgi:hypothetical protein
MVCFKTTAGSPRAPMVCFKYDKPAEYLPFIIFNGLLYNVFDWKIISKCDPLVAFEIRWVFFIVLIAN